jgi:hypothetical protein
MLFLVDIGMIEDEVLQNGGMMMSRNIRVDYFF